MIPERLARLRREMEKRNISVYIVPTADFHESEYVGDHFVSLASPPHALPEAAACAVTALLYLWRRNTLLSILAGTVCYMLMIQVIF